MTRAEAVVVQSFPGRPEGRAPSGSRRRLDRPAGSSIRCLAALSGILLWAASGGPAWAQARVQEEVIVEQSGIIERFSPPPVRGSASLRVPSLRERIPPELAAQRTLVLRNVRIEGATAMPAEAFRPLWVDLIGREVPVSELFELAARIEQLYLDDGLLVVASVPMQDLEDGDVRIVVFDQSYIRTVETRGDYPDIRKRLDPYISRLVALQPLRIGPIERVLLLMSDLAGMNISASLSRPETPGNGGALDLEINFEKRAAMASLDNRGTDEVGPLQAFATYQENDLFGLFESTAFTAVTVPNQPRELLFGQLAQDFPVGFDGLHLGYRLTATRSRPGGDLADLDLDVTSFTSETYASYPLLRTITHTIVARAGFSTWGTDVENGDQTESRDRYRWLFAGLDSEHDVGIGSLALQAGYLQGLNGLGATRRGAPLASREIAEPDFQVLTAGADLSVGLLENLTLTGRTVGQYAFGPLPAAVQITFGGDPFGRAFDSAVVSGDSAIFGALELSLDIEPPFDFVRHSAAYSFVDYGALWYRGDDRADAEAALASVGLGFRAFLDRGFSIDTTLAFPVEDDPGVEDSGARLFFSVAKQF